MTKGRIWVAALTIALLGVLFLFFEYHRRVTDRKAENLTSLRLLSEFHRERASLQAVDFNQYVAAVQQLAEKHPQLDTLQEYLARLKALQQDK